MTERNDIWAANAIREVINETLARYDVPSDAYEADTTIDGDCVRLADRIINRASQPTSSEGDAVRRVRLSWNMCHDGVAEVSATDADGLVFPVLDVFRLPLIERGKMNKEEARAFQAFAAERICSAWNSDDTAADIAEGHKIGGDAGLTEWGRGHDAACDQIAYKIRRRFKF